MTITPEEAKAALDIVNSYNEQQKVQQDEFLQTIRHIVASNEYQLVMTHLQQAIPQYANEANLIPHINGLVSIGITLMNVLGIQSTQFTEEAPAEETATDTAAEQE